MNYTTTVCGRRLSVNLLEKFNIAMFPLAMAEQAKKMNINSTHGSMYRQSIPDPDSIIASMVHKRKDYKRRRISFGFQVIRGFRICANSPFVKARSKRKNK